VQQGVRGQSERDPHDLIEAKAIPTLKRRRRAAPGAEDHDLAALLNAD